MSPAFTAVVMFLALAPQVPATETPNRLAMFAPLIGRQWVADFPGGNVTDTQRYEWVLGGKFVRNTHQVRASGQVVYEGETIYAWDERASRIVWWYWNSTGGHVTGTLTVDPAGGLLAEGENHGAADQLDRTRSIIRIGTDEWTSQGSQEKDGKWTVQPMRTYKPAK